MENNINNQIKELNQLGGKIFEDILVDILESYTD